MFKIIKSRSIKLVDNLHLSLSPVWFTDTTTPSVLVPFPTGMHGEMQGKPCEEIMRKHVFVFDVLSSEASIPGDHSWISCQSALTAAETFVFAHMCTVLILIKAHSYQCQSSSVFSCSLLPV